MTSHLLGSYFDLHFFDLFCFLDLQQYVIGEETKTLLNFIYVMMCPYSALSVLGPQNARCPNKNTHLKYIKIKSMHFGMRKEALSVTMPTLY